MTPPDFSLSSQLAVFAIAAIVGWSIHIKSYGLAAYGFCIFLSVLAKTNAKYLLQHQGSFNIQTQTVEP